MPRRAGPELALAGPGCPGRFGVPGEVRGAPDRGLAAAAPVTSAPRRGDVRSGAGGSSRRAPRRAGGGSGLGNAPGAVAPSPQR